MTISPIDIEETVIPAPLVENQVAADVPKEGTKTCPWCGTKNLDGATSCVNCASTLKRPS
nr:zinc-ribbon domain-containing protein [Candidatus Sigynarchaeota archaeon]